MTRAEAPPPPKPMPVNLPALFRLSPIGMFGAFCAGWISATNNGLLPVFTREIGMSIEGTSLFMFCLIFSGLLLQWPIGRLSDKMDRRRVLLMVALITLLSSGLMFLAVNSRDQFGFTPLFVLAAIYGSTFHTLYSISSAHIADNAAAQGSDMVAVASGILVVYGSGAIIGPIVAGQVMTALGPQGIFLTIAVMLLLLCLYVPYRRIRRAAVSDSEKQPFIPMPGTQFTGAGLYNAARREVNRAFSHFTDGFRLREGAEDAARVDSHPVSSSGNNSLNRTTSYPKDHWSLQVDIPYSMGIKQGDLIFLSGQADLKGKGEVYNAGDLLRQTVAAIAHIKRFLPTLAAIARSWLN